jgi:hypothetical protein
MLVTLSCDCFQYILLVCVCVCALISRIHIHICHLRSFVYQSYLFTLCSSSSSLLFFVGCFCFLACTNPKSLHLKNILSCVYICLFVCLDCLDYFAFLLYNLIKDLYQHIQSSSCRIFSFFSLTYNLCDSS